MTKLASGKMDKGLRKGVNTEDGKIRYEAVARSLKMMEKFERWKN